MPYSEGQESRVRKTRKTTHSGQGATGGGPRSSLPPQPLTKLLGETGGRWEQQVCSGQDGEDHCIPLFYYHLHLLRTQVLLGSMHSATLTVDLRGAGQ